MKDIIRPSYRLSYDSILRALTSPPSVVPSFLFTAISGPAVEGDPEEYKLETKDRFGVNARAQTVGWDKDSILCVIQLIPARQLFARYSSRGFAMTDDDFNIIEYSEELYELTRESDKGRDVRGLPLSEFILKEDWERFAEARKAWRNHLLERSGNPSPAWEEADASGPPSFFPFHGRDMRAEFETRFADPEGMGFFFAGRKDFTYTPDEGGCLVVVHENALHLKDNCQPVAVAPLTGLAQGDWNRFTIEKTGGMVLVTINGREAARSFDFSPAAETGAGMAGFFPGSRVEFRNFRLFLRPGRTDADRFSPGPADVRFKKRPDKIFRMETTRRRYGVHVLNGISFEDVTLLRQKENALARSERDRQILSRENLALRRESLLTEKWIRGTSPAMQQVYRTIEEIASTDATFLITGQTGTGKEVIARFIHSRSLRARGPFIKIDCAALPETLLEDELFGHEKGAFTGALSRRVGRFESADTGTVFLDEIANISLPIQAKLLRVIQDRAFERLGGAQTIRSDFRLICATNADLEALSAQGRFRSDLLYRINTIVLRMPPLSERRDDIPLFARTFIAEFAESHQRPARDISEPALRLLRDHPWPGNIRELRNTLERCVLLCPSTRIEAADVRQSLPASPAGRPPGAEPGIPSRRDLRNALRRSRGSVEKAAAALGLKAPRLYYLCKTMHLRPADFRRERTAIEAS